MPPNAAPATRLAVFGFLDELDRVADGLDRLGRVIGNFDPELFLEGP